jgi:ABC-type transport system substrate-binding protein
LSRRRFIAGATAAGAALAAACSSRGGNQAAKSSSTQAGKPKSGGTLNLQLIADFFDFDSSQGGKTVPNPNATTLVYDTLLAFQQGPNVDFDKTTIIPSLAERYEAPDAMTYTFHLRPGVRFANTAPVNGRALTSADAKFSFEYASRTGALQGSMLPAGQFGYMFEGLDSIQTPDAQTIVVKFSQPFAPFLSYVTTYGTQIVPHEIYDQDGSFSKQEAGTGPMTLDASGSQHGSRWSFKHNPAYWASGLPYLDRVNYLVFGDPATMYAAFQTKQLDILKTVADHDVKTVVAANPGATHQQAIDPAGVTGPYMSTIKPSPFGDPRMRQAVNLAINRDELDKTLGTGQGNWIMPASLPDLWSQAEIKQILKYDPQQAKQLIAAAGYPNGLNLNLMFAAGKDDSPTAQLLQAQLKQVGLQLNIEQIDAATKSQREHAGNYAMDLHGYPIFGDLDSRLYGSYHSKGTANQQRINDPKLDALIEAQRREPDQAKRRDALRAVTKYIAENAVDVALYGSTRHTFWQPYVKNYADNWQQYDFNVANVWLQK